MRGPNLYGIVGARVGRDPAFTYSFAMRERGEEGATWTYESLDAFLTSPQVGLPGTSMGFTGIDDPEDRAALIAWMRTQAEEPFPIAARVGVAVAGLRPTAFLRQQASMGETTYGGQCAQCHGNNLRGVPERGPSLIGGAFAERWFGGNAYDLFEYIRRYMPPQNPRGLNDFQYINVMSYILRENGFEANFEEEDYLPIGANELRAIGLYQY
jgi:cytochrome c2